MGYDDFDGFDYDYDTDSNNPSELRKAQKAAAKRARDLEAQVAKLTGQLAERNLKDVLAEKGLRPGLARVIAKEDVDLTDSKAVDAWLSDPVNQEDFGFSSDGGASGAATSSTDGAGDAEESDYAAKLARFQGAGEGALPDDKVQQARSLIKGSKTDGDLQANLDRAIANLT